MKKKIFVVIMIALMLLSSIVSSFALQYENTGESNTNTIAEVSQEELETEPVIKPDEVDPKEQDFLDYDIKAGGRKKISNGISFFAAKKSIVKHVKYRSLGNAYKVRHNWCDKNGDVKKTPYPDGTISELKTKEDGSVICIEGGYGIYADGKDSGEPSISDWNDDSKGWNKVTYTIYDIGTDDSIENKIYRIASKYSTGSTNKNKAFRQMLMWQSMPRKYDHAEGTANDGTHFSYFTNKDIRNEYNTWKKDLLNELKVWDTVPSFASSAMKIKAGETKTFTDTKGSMQYYNSFTITKNGITVKHSYDSNSITVTASSTASTSSVTMTKTEIADKGGVKYKDNGAEGSVKMVSSRAQNLKFVRGKVSPVYLSLSFDVTIKGKLDLKKTVASDEELVKLNINQYNLSGAEYRVYSDSACKNYVGKLTTGVQHKDSKGHLYAESGTLSLFPGTYYIKETKAPKGYKKDSVLHKATVSGGKTVTLSVKERPSFDPLTLTLKKHIPSGSKGTEKYLEGAEYTVRYYNDLYSSATDLKGKKPLRTWVFETDSDGMFLIDTPWFKSGDELFQQSDGTVVGLYGTYTFEETKAPEGFIKNSGLTIRQIKQGVVPDHIDNTNHGDAVNVAAEKPDNTINRKIIAVKKISKENVYEPYGTPTAIFKLVGTDLYGKKITYYKSITLTKDTLSGSYYTGSVTFDKLPAGNYELSEVKTSRYNLKSIVTNTANAVKSDLNVNIELVNHLTGKATYENEILRWNDFSDMECIVNRF